MLHPDSPFRDTTWTTCVRQRITTPSPYPGAIKAVLFCRLRSSPHFLNFEHLVELSVMSVESGHYTLKPGPVIGVGGMYATGNGLDHFVTLAAQVPSTAEHQVVSTNPPLLDEMAHVLVLPVGDFSRRKQGKHIHDHSPHEWQHLWRKLVPEGKVSGSSGPHLHFRGDFRMACAACRQWSSLKQSRYLVCDMSRCLWNVPHHDSLAFNQSQRPLAERGL